MTDSFINKQWPFQIKLSFERVIDKLEKTASETAIGQLPTEKSVTEKILASTEIRHGISSRASLEEHAAQISLLLNKLFPEELGNSEIKAACIPFTDIVFNHTNRFNKILKDAGPGFEFAISDHDAHHSYIACCCLILNKYYDANLDLRKPLFLEIPTSKGISKYYRLIYNTDFIEVLPTDKAVDITGEHIEQLINNYEELSLWKHFFPEGSWILKGFAIMSLFDVTIENATSVFKEKLLALKTQNFKESVTAIFKAIFMMPEIEIGFTLFEQETHRLRPALFNQQNLSFLLPDGQDAIAKRVLSVPAFNRIIQEHKNFVVPNALKFQEGDPENPIAKIFLQQEIRSFILAPVVKDGKLSGILEVVSHKTAALHSINAQKLEIVMPFLADAIERLITRFHLQIEAVIQKYYTAIHPSVKWKFSREAEKLLYHQELGQQYAVTDIILKSVYPLYGQIDVKGSTRQRIESVKKDLTTQLTRLADLLRNINYLPDHIPVPEQMLLKLQAIFEANAEEQIMSYLHHVQTQLMSSKHNVHATLIQSYINENDKHSGMFYEHRRNYERTIHLINETLLRVFDEEESSAQQVFPHYCEHHKSDGIEHILYVGRSLTPHLHYTHDMLSALRFWQIKTLCKMNKAHQRLKKDLPYPLEVTGLILVYQHPLTLRFRSDEKKLDVDGTYNIGFEVLKKRIDKAMIKNTGERITAPGKLTVVYADLDNENEYISYFKELQSQGMLEEKWEIVEVEDLQDVSGLKALRVSYKQ